MIDLERTADSTYCAILGNMVGSNRHGAARPLAGCCQGRCWGHRLLYHSRWRAARQPCIARRHSSSPHAAEVGLLYMLSVAVHMCDRRCASAVSSAAVLRKFARSFHASAFSYGSNTHLLPEVSSPAVSYEFARIRRMPYHPHMAAERIHLFLSHTWFRVFDRMLVKHLS